MALVRSKPVHTPRIVQPSARRYLWWGVPLVALLALWTWQVFEFGRLQGGFDEQSSTDLRSRYLARIHQLEQEVEALQLDVASHQRASQIDRDAARRVQRELLALQTERSDLRRELALMRGLVASNNSLRIKDVRLSAESDPGGYRYSFTVAQLKEQKDMTQGQILIKVAGEKGGKSQELSLKELTAGESTSLKMRFKHFQNVEGRLSLPKEFEPQSLIIEVKPKTKNAKPIEQSFDWARLVS
jgi:phage FluMu protein gp41